jgi:hypothetical protein
MATNRSFDNQTMQLLEMDRRRRQELRLLCGNQWVRDTDAKLLIAPGLYHGDVNFVDNSLSHHVISGDAGIMHTVDQTPFRGSNSINFVKTSTRFLSIPDHADWDIFQAGISFTVDLWFKRNTEENVNHTLLSQFQSTAENWILIFSSGVTRAMPILVCVTGGVAVVSLASAIAVTDITYWHHLACVRSGDDYGMYLDGVQIAFVNSASTADLTGPLYIGQRGNGALCLNAYLSNIRITHANDFGAVPVVGLTDIIQIPIAPYTWQED